MSFANQPLLNQRHRNRSSKVLKQGNFVNLIDLAALNGIRDRQQTFARHVFEFSQPLTAGMKLFQTTADDIFHVKVIKDIHSKVNIIGLVKGCERSFRAVPPRSAGDEMTVAASGASSSQQPMAGRLLSKCVRSIDTRSGTVDPPLSLANPKCFPASSESGRGRHQGPAKRSRSCPGLVSRCDASFM